MQIIKNTRSLIVVLTIAALALTVTYAPKSSANDWWSQVEQCVKEKETAKRNSDDSHLDPWMYNEWEEECANEIPPMDTVVEVVDESEPELEIQLASEYLPLYNTTIGKVIITSLSDSAQINGVKVNRGNCKASHRMTSDSLNFPVKLTYSQSTTLYLHCKVDTVREVTVTIPLGDMTYTFR